MGDQFVRPNLRASLVIQDAFDKGCMVEAVTIARLYLEKWLKEYVLDRIHDADDWEISENRSAIDNMRGLERLVTLAVERDVLTTEKAQEFRRVKDLCNEYVHDLNRAELAQPGETEQLLSNALDMIEDYMRQVLGPDTEVESSSS